ncbi:c-type cytochrome [Bosea sp. (in: a-proteobacteria)]|uniref:c-type cytochrome n=1 Tax=Bosea sp. (in: a-proteobacteria) TaxID=1871050 RepID=UPI00086F72DC|nr:c-type cytochrome [Bosea sp. (in: a-proteobacteria)]MBN9435598.1 cytochrome c [Bosea sp. (in: a-proteobacteria)]ODT52717.1 MAG: cytochrome C [Methylobacterium sp. SCN 67-24]
MHSPLPRLAFLAAALFAAATSASADSAPPKERVQRGEYLAGIMDCGGCHTPGVFLGKPDKARSFAGSEVGFQIPGLGTFYPPNLTPDPETGLGKWSELDIIKAVRTGVRPDGRVLSPAMPYESYRKLNDTDALALATYFKSLKPVKNAVPALAGPSEKPSAPYLAVVSPQ